MLASPAALHRSRLYRLVARLVIVTLLLQALLPVPGPGIPVAQADEEPPISVQVLEPPPAVPTQAPIVIPDPVVAVPPDAPLITIPWQGSHLGN